MTQRRSMPETRVPFDKALASFDRAAIRDHIAQGKQERKEATARFPRDEWPTLPLERYALGQENSEDTFCRWMEFRTTHMGSIKGGSSRKHIIFKRKDKPGWYFDPEYKDEQDAWAHVR